MCGLDFRIGPSNERSGFAQSEPKTPEHALTLPYSDLNPIPFMDECRQGFAIPKMIRKSHFRWGLAQQFINLSKLSISQSPGTASFSPSDNPASPSFSKRRTQYCTVLTESPSNRETSLHLIP